MRPVSILLIIGLVVASSMAQAAPKKSTRAKQKAQGDLKTDVRFDDSVLHGQYQVPDEALAKVENEEGLNDLLGIRKNFKDRLLESAGQE